MLVRNLVTPQISVPGEPNEWMQFRKLNNKRLARCEAKRMSDAMEHMQALGNEGLAFINNIVAVTQKQENTPSTPPTPPKVDPANLYDADTLLKEGIAAWSYDAGIAEEIDSEDGGLDPATAKWAVGQILKFNGLLPEDLGN